MNLSEFGWETQVSSNQGGGEILVVPTGVLLKDRMRPLLYQAERKG